MLFFFFKQKTAYEMRISDWSSDVCSSDLLEITVAREEEFVEQFKWQNALLRNSWSYFAQKSGTLSRGGALTVAAGNGLSRTVDRLLPAMMLVQHQPRSEAIDLATLELARQIGRAHV